MAPKSASPKEPKHAPAEGNAMARLHKAVEPLRDKYGANVDRFLNAVQEVHPSAHTIDGIAYRAEELLKLQPSDETMASVMRVVDKMYTDKLDHIIAELSLTKIAIGLMKRNEEFLVALLGSYQKLSEVNPILFMGALHDQSFKELLFFSEDGLGRWVADGKSMFSSGSTVNIPEFFRYCMMVTTYSDVAQYKISENSVFLENIQDSLTLFAMLKFNRRLIAVKSRTHVPHVTESDDIKLFLPDYTGHYPNKADNELEYYMDVLHEGSHITEGSFVLDFPALAGFLEQNGIRIKKLELMPDSLRVKKMVIEKDEDGKSKEYLCTSKFHLSQLLVDPKHMPFVKRLDNILDDLKIDSTWLDTRAPGYRDSLARMMDYFFYEAKYRGTADTLTAKNFLNGLCEVYIFLSISKEKEAFMEALKAGKTDGPDGKAIGNIIRMHPEVLSLVLQFEKDLLELAKAREKNSNRVFLTSLKMYRKVKHLVENEETNDGGKNGEGFEGTGGPLSLSDIDPENVEFSMNPGEGMDMNDLPDEIKDKLKKKFDAAFKNMSEEDKKKLAEQMAGCMLKPGEGEKKDGQQLPQQGQVSGNWNVELVDGVEVKDYINITETRLTESQCMANREIAAKIRATALRMMQTRKREITGAFAGEVDPYERAQWNRLKSRGIMLPRDYHLMTESIIARSISILTIGDASGSTQSQAKNGDEGEEKAAKSDSHNGRKIDYITASKHTLALGLEGIPGIRNASGYFNSSGRENVYYYEEKKFGEPQRFAKVEPNHANRDGAIIRKAGEILSKETTDVKIALFVMDSMPADDNEYGGKRGVEDVRHALTSLKKAGILPYVITVPPDDSYWKHSGFNCMEDYLDYIYMGKANYAVITSEKHLDGAFEAFVKANLRKLRRTVIE